MGSYYDPLSEAEQSHRGHSIITHPLYLPRSSPWFDLKVFYVRVINCEVDESTPEQLTLNHIPLNPDIILEVNGRRSSVHSDYISSSLRRDRVDKKSEEVTYVSTDRIRMTGSARFEVYDRNNLLLVGVLELCNANDTGEAKNHNKKWSMKCHSEVTASMGSSTSKQHLNGEPAFPKIEVYVAGCFAGNPIVLTKVLQLGPHKRHQMKPKLDSIPEDETVESEKQALLKETMQLRDFDADDKSELDLDDYGRIYTRAEYLDGEDGELSWFNAGVRVGVGLGLGICLGIGLGVGLLVRTYQSTTRNFKRRII